MTADEIRKIENYALSQPLSMVEDADMLAFLATLIQDHDHFREKLMTEPNREKRYQKYGAMCAHLRFRAHSLTSYEIAEAARNCGVQPIYQEQADMDYRRLILPPSVMRVVRG